MLNNVITLNDVQKELSEMTENQMNQMVQTSLEFKNATGYEVEQILKIVENLRNEDVGISNKVLCASYDRNHWDVIAFMVKIEWLNKDNTLTEKGFREMNDAYDIVGIDIGDESDDVLVLQNYNGSLYWNRKHTEFERVWKIILQHVEEDRQYNKSLKDTRPPISPQTKKLLLNIPNMNVTKNGIVVNRKKGE